LRRLQKATQKKCGCHGHCDHPRFYTAKEAAKGHRTKKSGQSEWFVGYKKHTLRILFLNQSPIWSIPAITVVKPANTGDGDVLSEMILLWPQYLPAPIIVADMGYLQAERKKQLREQYKIALITRVRASMKPPQNFGLEPDGCPTCFWGQRLRHDFFDWEKQKHLYLKPDEGQKCYQCLFSFNCPQESWLSPEIHETYLCAQPLHTKLAQKLLQYARPVAEPAFNEDKNRFMLKSLFINSLSLAEFASLLVDSTKLLTTLVRLKETHGKQLKKTSNRVLDQLKLPLFS
jgi:hypothetical protein